MKSWIAACLCFAIGSVVIGCVSAPKPVVISPTDPAIRYGGYVDARDPQAPRFAWPGTHLALRFSGTSLKVTLTSTPVEDETRETDWIAVVIDDGPPRTLKLKEGKHEYPLVAGLPQGSHRALIWKRTEAEVGTITFHGLRLEDGATAGPPLPAPLRRILFVGDSITAGYGNEGPDMSCEWNVAFENNYATYGAVAARMLDAEYVATAWSGKGIYRNYDGRDQETMLDLYQRVIPTEQGSPKVPALPMDAVVVNLGTNDFGLGVPDKAKMLAAFDKLLVELRGRYPRALVVLVLGPMLIDEEAGVNGGVKARSMMRGWLGEVRVARAAKGDSNLAFLEVWTDPAEGVGCGAHPNDKTHARLAAELVALMKQRLGW